MTGTPGRWRPFKQTEFRRISPGTGDLFASVLTGALTRGAPLLQAARTAVDFVGSCVARSVAEGADEAEGVDFEPLLRQLTVK